MGTKNCKGPEWSEIARSLFEGKLITFALEGGEKIKGRVREVRTGEVRNLVIGNLFLNEIRLQVKNFIAFLNNEGNGWIEWVD